MSAAAGVRMKTRTVMTLLVLQIVSGGCEQWKPLTKEGGERPATEKVAAQKNNESVKGDEYLELFSKLPGPPPSKGCQTSDYESASEVQCFVLSQNDLLNILRVNDQTSSGRIKLFSTGNVPGGLFISKDSVALVQSGMPALGYRWFGGVYSGVTSQKKIGTALLSIRGDRMVARITAENEVFEVRPLGNGVHAVIKVDLSKLPPIHPRSYLDREKRSSLTDLNPFASFNSWVRSNWQPEIFKVANATTVCNSAAKPPINRNSVPTIRVVFAYEISALKPFERIEDLVNAYVGFTQTALENSRVALNVSLPGSGGIRSFSDFVVDHETLIDVVNGNTSSAGAIGEIHRWREEVKADLVVILTKNAGICGRSAQVKPDEREYGFAIVQPTCLIAQLQVAHEIGHLLGGDHELDNARSVRSDSDARAYILEGLDTKTIMHLDNGVPEPYYSNPDVCWDSDHPMGIEGVANNARAMSARAEVVSKFCK
jgi:Metallo-peptidase family M12B Reprolysin-like